MAEALGVGAAGVQLFETAIVIFKHVKKAYKRQKELSGILDKYQHELVRIRDLAELVKNEKALEGANVTAVLARLNELATILSKWLDKVDPGDKNSIRQFADQLVHGAKDRKKLDDIMKDLDRVKCDLSSIIQLRQIRISYSTNQAVVANSRKITVDLKPKKRESPRGAKVTISTKRRPKVDGPATPSDSGISSMESEDDTSTDDSSGSSGPDEPASAMPQVPMIRRIKRNTTKRGSSMINAPLGKDLWKNVPVVEIEDNVAEEDSMMINYRMDKRGLELAREQHEWRKEQQREQILWDRHHRAGVS